MPKIKKIKLKIGFTGADRQSILEDLDFAAKNEFNHYQIQGLGEKFQLAPKIIKKAKIVSKQNNISLTLHAAMFLPIASLAPEVAEGAFKFLKKEVVLANKLGAKRMTIHSGSKDISFSETATTKNFEILIKNLKRAVKLGKKYGIKIGLENLSRDVALCAEAKDLLKVVNAVKGLGITFDIGHAAMRNLNPVRYFREIKDFISEAHIHDSDGKDDHKPIGKGKINFKEFLKECKNSGYYGPFTFEVFPQKNVLESKKQFLKIWNQI